MSSWAARYDDGEHWAVWDEIRRLGPVDASLKDEVDEVARSTMRRVGRQLDRIVEGVTRAGWVPSSTGIAIRRMPPADASDRISKVEAVVGPIPAALRAYLTEVGLVWLAGDVPELGLRYEDGPVPDSMPPGPGYPDPLCTSDVGYLEWSLDEWLSLPEDVRPLTVDFEFEPDELHKAGVSGGTHDIRLPSSVADPILSGVYGRPGITLVQYLRVSVSWGGMPGYAFSEEERPSLLDELRATPDF